MIPADQAFIDVWNRTAVAYTQDPPAFITYDEYTHASAPSLGRSQDINRSVQVRQADNFAVMRDLPNGGERTGKAFPIIPYFDPFSSWSYSWFANLKNVNIDLIRYPVGTIVEPPPDPSATFNLTYLVIWYPSYFPDSAPGAEHLKVLPTPALLDKQMYFPDVRVDPHTHLPSHVEIKWQGIPDDLTLDYRIMQGHWVITHATYTSPQHVGPFSFTAVTEVTYKDMAFPQTAPDARLSGTPGPLPTLPPQGG